MTRGPEDGDAGSLRRRVAALLRRRMRSGESHLSSHAGLNPEAQGGSGSGPRGIDPGRPAGEQPLLGDGWRSGRSLISAIGSRVSALPYARRWLILGLAMGVVAGLGAVLFYTALTLGTHFLLFDLGGYQVPTPGGEGNLAGSAGFTRPWAIPLVVAFGGLLSGLLVYTWAPEAEGHGTDAAIEAFHRNPRGIRLRAVLVKIVASALTIGSGGSGGREGPTAQISAGFGSLLSRLLDLSPEDGRLAVAVGIGSGIGSIFSAPLGGAVLAAEILYRDDFELAALFPGLVASAVGYVIFGAFEGYQPLFSVVSSYRLGPPLQLLWFAIIGVACGAVGLLYSKGFYGMVSLSSKLPFTRKLRPALGGLLVGLIALGLPEVLGTGYGWVQKGLGPGLLQIPLYAVLLIPFARILATGLSIGTGGSGGVFGPGMVIGAFTGAAVWRVLAPIAPFVPHDPAVFVVVGMMACFGAIAWAPLAVMLMVAEMTGTIALLVPAMISVFIASLLVRQNGDSIYRSQLRTRDDSPAARFRFGMPLLGTITVSEVAMPARLVLPERTSLGEARQRLHDLKLPGAPVVDRDQIYLGTLSTEDLDVRHGARSPGDSVAPLVDPTAPTVPASARLDVALESITQAGGHWVTVTDGARRVLGVLTFADLVAGYYAALHRNVGTMSQVSQQTRALEERIGRGSGLLGEPLAEIELPPGCIVVTVLRGEDLSFVRPDTELQVGDVVGALTEPGQANRMRELIRGDEVDADPAGERGTHMV